MIIWLIIFILITVYWKWIIFVLVVPLIIFKNSHKNQIIENSNNNYENKNSNLINIHYFRNFFVGFIRYIDIQVGLIPSHHIRDFIYKYIFKVKIGKKSVIYYGAEIRNHSKLIIGNGSIIGDKAILDARNGIEIGDNVNFSTRVQIWTEQHDHKDSNFACTSDQSYKVVVHNRAWIGPDVIILHSVEIGEGSVIAAGAVLTKNVPPFEIWAGIPAKKIGERNKNLSYNLSGEYLSFY